MTQKAKDRPWKLEILQNFMPFFHVFCLKIFKKHAKSEKSQNVLNTTQKNKMQTYWRGRASSPRVVTSCSIIIINHHSNLNVNAVLTQIYPA